MILVHLSFDPIDHFEPRVPKHQFPSENKTVPRICLSERVDRALCAIPQGGFAARAMFDFRKTVAPVLHAYICDTAADPGAFLPPEIVESKYGVYDAPYTREWWALKTPAFVHKIIRLVALFTHEETDLFGKQLMVVDCVNYRFCPELPKNAPERICDKAMREYRVSVRDIYTAIALGAITPEKWGLCA